jgi:hypothetical protein
VAALTPTFLTGKLPLGHKVTRTFRVSVTSDAAADEWVDTGLTYIDAVLGFAVIGQAGAVDVPAFRKNARGTGVAEGTNPGDLAIEVVATDLVLEITVIGKA